MDWLSISGGRLSNSSGLRKSGDRSFGNNRGLSYDLSWGSISWGSVGCGCWSNVSWGSLNWSSLDWSSNGLSDLWLVSCRHFNSFMLLDRWSGDNFRGLRVTEVNFSSRSNWSGGMAQKWSMRRSKDSSRSSRKSEVSQHSDNSKSQKTNTQPCEIVSP